MSRHAPRHACARVATVLSVPVLVLGFLALPASAAPAQSLVPCTPQPASGGYRCDMNDIAALLSGAIGTGEALTCTNPEQDVVVCRPGETALVR